MVSLQFWKKKVDEPISKVLKQLQSQINTHEIRVSSLRTKQRSITGQITLYSVLIYLAYIVYYALGKNYGFEGQTFLTWTLKIGVMLLFPAMVYGMRRSVRWWYTRRIEREIQEKEAVKNRLDEKIDELKEKSDYYNTQQLLERYDPKSLPKSSNSERGRGQPIDYPLQRNIPSTEIQSLRQRGNPNLPLPPLPPPISPSTFAPPPPLQSQNIPQFHPSAFSPPPSPVLADQPQSKTFFGRVLDLVVGEDENAADNRYALICRHCRAHNGLAPPGERGDEVGYLCGRCGGWNGPDPKQKPLNIQDSTTEERGDKEKQSVERSSGDAGHTNSDDTIKVQEGQGDIGEKPQE